MSNLDGLTQLEVETIQYNLNAFDVTFQPLMIIKKNKQFFVFQNDMSKYVYVTRSIQNLTVGYMEHSGKEQGYQVITY